MPAKLLEQPAEWGGECAFGEHVEEPLPVEQWCQPCRDNLPTFEAMKKARARMGGLMSALMRAYRAEAAGNDQDPSTLDRPEEQP